MNEDFLFYIWRYLKFDITNLKTCAEEPIQIIKVGTLNTNGGPDFNNAQIAIGTTMWYGRVEIHVNAKEWDNHNHSQDYKYDNVILHVVYKNDKQIYRRDGSPIPTLELAGRIPLSYKKQYESLWTHSHWLPCSGQIKNVSRETKSMWLERLFVERIEAKANAIRMDWLSFDSDWEQTLYVWLAKGFGLRINTEPFALLAQSLPLNILYKSSFDIRIIEALVMGQSGLLNTEHKDDYVVALAKEYDYQRRKHNLTPLKNDIWQWLRLRPASFPSVRLAQWSQLIVKSKGLFSKILEVKNVKEIETIFEVEASVYWDNHYVLGKLSNNKIKKFSKTSIHLLVVNVLAPILFLYGKEKGEQRYIDKSYELLTQLPSEKNKIIRQWAKEGESSKTAFESQAYLHLHKHYCATKKCLNCSIGHQILRGC